MTDGVYQVKHVLKHMSDVNISIISMLQYSCHIFYIFTKYFSSAIAAAINKEIRKTEQMRMLHLIFSLD